MRHLILEGPDGSGKTTLARMLCQRFQMAYHHEGPPPKTVSCLHHYGGLLANAKRPTVFDRFHLGETVYGPILRGASGLDATDLKLLARVIVGSGTSVVVCLPPWETCVTNTAIRSEYLTEDQRKDAYERWSTMALPGLQPHRNMLSYDYTLMGHPGPDFAKYFLNYLALADGVIGSPFASILLVGEQPNSTELDLAFFGVHHSSRWINDRIREAGIAEDTLALTNAYDMAGQPRDLNWIVSQMPQLKVVVTLGKKAFDLIEENPLPKFITVKALTHPQFWKRFHADKTPQYTNMLREAYYAAL